MPAEVARRRCCTRRGSWCPLLRRALAAPAAVVGGVAAHLGGAVRLGEHGVSGTTTRSGRAGSECRASRGVAAGSAGGEWTAVRRPSGPRRWRRSRDDARSAHGSAVAGLHAVHGGGSGSPGACRRTCSEALRLPSGAGPRRAWSSSAAAAAWRWMDLPAPRSRARSLRYAAEVRGQFDTLVVLGIGGSALGTTALATALLHPYHNMLPSGRRWRHAPALRGRQRRSRRDRRPLLSTSICGRTLVNVVSKSGTTAETMAAYL